MQTTAPPSPAPLSAPAPRFDVKLVAPFVDSVRTVFKTMANVEIKVLKPYMKTAAGHYNVFGIIGFSGEIAGTVTVSFTLTAALNLVEAFTGSPAESDTSHFADAIGELANMIAGSAKSKLGLDAKITVPSVIIGDHCHVATLSDMPCIVIPCTSPQGEFAVEVSIKQKKVA